MVVAQTVELEMTTAVLPGRPETDHLESAVPPSEFLADKLTRLRQKLVRTSVLLALSVAVLVGVEVLALAMFFDWLIDLPWSVRAALLLAQLAFLSWLFIRYIVAPLVRQPHDEALALLVERARPQLRTRLIAAVQLTRPGALPAGASTIFVRALVDETEAIAAGIDFNGIVSSERVRTIGLAACCVLVVASAGFIYGRPATPQLLKRALLSHVSVPRKTRVEVRAGNKTIGRGDDVRLEAGASGIVPERGTVDIRSAERRTQSLAMDWNGNVFTRTIENVQESFAYQVRLNDGRSDWFQVKVLPRPSVLSVSCEQQFPVYTGLSPRTPQVTDLALLAGSVLRLAVVPSKDIASAAIRLIGLETNLPMEVLAPRQLRGQFQVPAKGINGFSIELRDTERMTSKDSAVYRVDILPDKPPVVRITSPARREELFTKQATVLVAMDVSDDFQIARMRLRYKADATEDALARSIDFDIGREPLKTLRRRFEWNFRNAGVDFPIGTRIEFWIEAEDNNDVTGPGIGTSERYFGRFVTDEEKRADLWNRASDTLSGISDLANDQQKLTENLGTLIRERGASKSNTP